MLLGLVGAGIGCDRGPAAAVAVAPDTVEATIGGRSFTLQTAVTEEQRYRGLSGVASLPPGGGMVFAFPDAAPRAFVMRDCLIPLDIVFLDPGGRVIRTAHMPLEPAGTPERSLPRYESGYPSQFVIELAGGTLETLRLVAGDAVGLPYEALRAAAE
ncbi:DUF192 domain-containing protein [Phycisphaera mikurensis]|uniref:DUF192 domain-containing protein n=1 Tax=Phycisphaera mikurensis (strain NBRC 102666 / KCTC 22515 / FYK2301M01) TaxID=1142394 RepID=I0IFF6_PHYMF|nr:DUF192 domain-containing protein [Phycisphaera mikurensis]MBB6440614.1 hypothetical protein [Phycisphaera mikurensis]BAM03994.1 hypothetical protein PSMK_18350 [Phycisphaera mikurensis NBRC 102666]